MATSFRVTSTTSTSITVRVSGWPSGTGYIRFYIGTDTSDMPYDGYKNVSGSSYCTYTFSGLEPGTEYALKISPRAATSDQEAMESATTIWSETEPESATWSLSSTNIGTITSEYQTSLNLNAGYAKRFAVSFAVDGEVTVHSTGNVDLIGYVGTDSGFDESSGTPTIYIVEDDDSGTGNNFSMTFNATPNWTYYIVARAYDIDTSVSGSTIVINPPASQTWTLDSATFGTVTSDPSRTVSIEAMHIVRYSMIFRTAGTATFYTTGSYDTKGYITKTTAWDSSTGVPTNILAEDDDSGDGNNFSIAMSVSANETYYIWVRAYSSSTDIIPTVHVIPPSNRPQDWDWPTTPVKGQPITMTAQNWNDFCARINEFRVYKSLSTYSFTATVSGQTIKASVCNQARTAIDAIDGHGTLPSAAVKGEPLTASFFTTLQSALNAIP